MNSFYARHSRYGDLCKKYSCHRWRQSIVRIFITGPTGSGKSTLSQRLGKFYGIPAHSLDSIHWVPRPGGDERRPLEEKISLLQELVRGESWVIEGVQFKWADLAISSADIIIVLDIPVARNCWLIIKRFVKQYLRVETAAYEPGLKSLVRIFRWNADYRGHERAQLMAKLHPFGSKTTIVNCPDHACEVVRKLEFERKY